ncbi:lytic transglycosylase domain-containing protein [Acuticoccus sp. MNP-M23]|uniref:lytic transglycosylase domain-containing protein n=1 Tax=Acuticoccus sp. MNP-M23 TaxID=3072793 RepID=UPI002815EC24|nr:lytic transglycosylase domain-containing protein [Acuticoccus sp. MNP-M23]WMS43423.1 lytic transglycosylase domain-containing protein [Acuticoccus sp. MNP-M23]
MRSPTTFAIAAAMAAGALGPETATAAPLRPPVVSSGVVLVDSPLPRGNPVRAAAPARFDNAFAEAPETAPAVAAQIAAGHALPRRRPSRAKVVGRVENGVAVPVASAYAAANDGPVASLFSAPDAVVSGLVSAPPPVPTVVAAPPAANVALSAHGQRDSTAYAKFGRRSGSFKNALDALRADRYEEVFARRNALSDPLDVLTIDYLVVRAGPPELTYAMVADFIARGKGWPDPKMIQTRAEESLARERPSAAAVIRALNGKAISGSGVRLLGKAYLETGDRAAATRAVRAVWHNRALGVGLQGAYAEDFGAILTVDDHLSRIDYLIGEGRSAEAKGLRSRLGTGPRAYMDARLAAAEGASGANALLKRVPAAYRKRPGYSLAAAEVMRRADDLAGAAKLLSRVSPRTVVNGDAWWIESRIVARSLAEKGDWRSAYALASIGFAESNGDKADEAFHAGWFALTGLKDGAAAERHFAALEQIATTPLSLSRAAYWRGKAAAQRGDSNGARKQLQIASRYGFTYYGQLARTELGIKGTGVGKAPKPTGSDIAAMKANPLAVATTRLVAAGHAHRIWPLLKTLGETVKTPGQATLAVKLALDAGYPHLALMTAKEAQQEGIDVGQLAYPTQHIPRSAKIPAGLDRAVVYSIARQESQFNSGAKSPVGAAGLMQVMPRTAASVAKELGLRHSQSKLTSDPAYNATLGAAYLKKRLGNFDGSYILTFAAYNAGAGRVREWIERFGDPRDRSVDPITWVEQIPYPETRNYVQRVMENVQVYREALGTGQLAITGDLKRGRQS